MNLGAFQDCSKLRLYIVNEDNFKDCILEDYWYNLKLICMRL